MKLATWNVNSIIARLPHVTRWLDTGQLYLPRQLAGPTVVMDGDPLYPPTILLLLLPFRVIPEPVWWLVPVAIMTGLVD